MCRDRKLLVGMPTTNVVIESVERRRHQLSQRRQWLRSESLLRQEQDDYAENAGDVDFLNDFIREMEPKKKHLRVHCNVSIVSLLNISSLLGTIRYQFRVYISVETRSCLNFNRTNFRASPCSECNCART